MHFNSGPQCNVTRPFCCYVGKQLLVWWASSGSLIHDDRDDTFEMIK